MSTDQNWIRTEANFGWIGLQFFSKLADKDWIGMRKILLF